MVWLQCERDDESQDCLKTWTACDKLHTWMVSGRRVRACDYAGVPTDWTPACKHTRSESMWLRRCSDRLNTCVQTHTMWERVITQVFWPTEHLRANTHDACKHTRCESVWLRRCSDRLNTCVQTHTMCKHTRCESMWLCRCSDRLNTCVQTHTMREHVIACKHTRCANTHDVRACNYAGVPTDWTPACKHTRTSWWQLVHLGEKVRIYVSGRAAFNTVANGAMHRLPLQRWAR